MNAAWSLLYGSKAREEAPQVGLQPILVCSILGISGNDGCGMSRIQVAGKRSSGSQGYDRHRLMSGTLGWHPQPYVETETIYAP